MLLRSLLCSVLTSALGLLAFTINWESRATADEAAISVAAPVDSTIANLRQLADTLYTSGEPKSEDDFRELQKLGIRTIVSVDGARPQVELAKRYGMRSVHVPLRYDGITREQVLSLVRALQECESPMLIHCHHGKHRGPAAAVVACVVTGRMTRVEATTFLEKAGTGREYAGLWQAVKTSAPVSADEKLPKLVAVAEVEALPETMARIDRLVDRVIDCADNLADPRVRQDGVEAAVLLREEFFELGRNTEGSSMKGARAWYGETEKTAEALTRILRGQFAESEAAGASDSGADSGSQDSDTTPAEKPVTDAKASAKMRAALLSQLSSLKSVCVQCHAAHRD